MLQYKSRREPSENRAAHILSSAPYDSTATGLFRRLYWKNLSNNKRLSTKAIMMFKTLNGETPDYLSNKFIFCNHKTHFRLRGVIYLAFKLFKGQTLVNIGQHFFLLN